MPETKQANQWYPSAYSSLVLTFGLLISAICYVRIYFGIDFNDEAFYIAVPYRFILGDRPFIDEKSLIQLSGLLMFPFLKIFHWVTGGIQGAFLYWRHLHFGFFIFVAISVFLVIRKMIKWQLGFLVSLTVVTFAPFNIFGLSYNTLGSGFLTLGLFVGFFGIFEKSKKCLFSSGLYNALAAISYPPLIVITLAYGGIIFYLSRRDRHALTWYTTGSSIPFMVFFIIFLYFGIENVIRSFHFATSFGPQLGGIEKVTRILSGVWVNIPNKTILILLLLVIVVGMKYEPSYFKYSFLLLPLVVFKLRWDYYFGQASSSIYVLYYSMLAPYLLLFLRRNDLAQRLFCGVWIPSFIAGVVTSYTSGNGYVSAAIGLLPGFIVTSIMVVLVYSDKSQKKETALTRTRLLHMFSVILLILIFVFYRFSTVYDEDKISLLNTRITAGPFFGLYTTREKSNYLSELTDDLRHYGEKHKRILIYDRLPAGFLLTSLRPATDTCLLFPWMRYPEVKRRYGTLEYYERYNIEPDIVIKVLGIYEASYAQLRLSYSGDPLNSFVESNRYEKVLEKKDYVIYRRRSHDDLHS
jgi:hypothetical protein